MDFSKIAPTIDDFLKQVDAINFDQEEIDFQKKSSKNTLSLNHSTNTLKIFILF